ncbi:MAG: LLM class flavin-dependent oxidoreductase [Sulfurifustaceae bacterium]
MKPTDKDIELFSTCPPSSGTDQHAYRRQVADVARWSEEAGCTGILVYADNSLLDPWLLAHLIVQETRALCPLVAVQPIYMHPYTVAKNLTSIAYLYGRRLYLNMVAGGFKNDLIALNDATPHDSRYERLAEYTAIIQQLAAGGPVSYEGKFYKVDKLKLAPPLPAELFPGIFVSGSSDAGLAAARTMKATAIKYPKPLADSRNESPADGVEAGVRVGIVSREHEDEAWQVARARFPEDRKGQLTRQLANKVSDSVWHKQLAELGERTEPSPYWTVPFENYKTMCPYLVGSYDRVGQELAGYIALGYRTFIIDVPPSAEELMHIRMAFARAREVAECPSYSKTG